MAAFLSLLVLTARPASLSAAVSYTSAKSVFTRVHYSSKSGLCWSVVDPYNAIRLKLTPHRQAEHQAYNNEGQVEIKKWIHDEFRHQLKCE